MRLPAASTPRTPRPIPPGRRLAPVVLALAAVLAACAGPAATGTSPAASAVAQPSTAASAAPASSPTSTAPSPSPAASPAGAAFPLDVTDDEGTKVTLAAQPKRIVSLTPATTEILFAIGAGDLVVAKSEDPTPYPPAASGLPVVTNLGAVDVEKIVGLSPDLVIAGGLGFTSSDAVTKLRGLHIPVVVVYGADVPGVLADVRLTAVLAGKPAAGDALAASMQADMDGIAAAALAAARSGGAKAPRVFYEIDATKEIYGPADRSFLAGMIQMAGGDPITTGSPDAYSIPLERLITADPQIILLGDAAYGTTVDAVKARTGWAAMTAVKAGAIRPVDDVVITRPGPRLPDGLRDLALAINPSLVLPSPAPSPTATAAP